MLENRFNEEETNIVWSFINYLYNDLPHPIHLLLKEWESKYGHHYDEKAITDLFYGMRGDSYKALQAYNKASSEALDVLKNRLEEILLSGHNSGN